MDLLQTQLQMLSNDTAYLARTMAYIMISTGAMTLISLLFLKAEYGRYSQSNSVFGFGIRANLAWFIQESPSVIAPIVCLLGSKRLFVEEFALGVNPQTVLLGCFLLHYSQRTFIYPWLIRGGKDTPFLIMMLALAFTGFNGIMQYVGLLQSTYPEDYFHQPRFMFGIILFSIGFFANLHADHILRNLRKPGETGYKIPYGGVFRFVSAGNYFAESLEWLGFAIAANNLTSLAFFLFTVANLGPRAMQHHQWYKKKFDNYPENRKAFIPFIL